MNAECIREREVLELVRAGQWPASCEDEVRTHVAQCSHCDETVRVASVMTADLHAAMRTVQVPTSGVVWWRAQRRAREEAAQAATRAVTLVQAISVIVGLIAAMLAIDSTNFRRAFTFASHEWLSATTLSQWTVPLAIGIAVWLAIAPVAVYLAVSRD
jgi:hypothetical protein